MYADLKINFMTMLIFRKSYENLTDSLNVVNIIQVLTGAEGNIEK